jgi:hypothetical protein
MFAITIRQPFVWQIFAGEKDKEYRSWPTSYRGPLAIHAGLSTVGLGKGWRKIVLTEDGKTAGELLLFGVIVGIVDVIGCPWNSRAGCYAWRLANPRRLDKPISIKGQLRLWKLPASVKAAVRAQLED